MISQDLHVVAVVSNPYRYKVRYRLFKEFEARMKAQGINLYVAELAFGDRPFEITESYNPQHFQFRTPYELWHKENLINLAIARLPPSWEYVAWVDADIEFVREDWALETIQQLQHHAFVQLWQTAIDMGPTGEAMNTWSSAGWCFQNGKAYGNKGVVPIPPGYYYGGGAGRGANGIYWHSGFAWGARRSALDHVGGLLDRAILGAGDHHMALALCGMGDKSIPGYMCQHYKDYVMRWQEQADKWVRRNVGYVQGTIVHHWHGRKADRKYWSRWQVLKDGCFDPVSDLKRDWQGLYQLVDHGDQRSIILRDGIRQYFRQRNEDSIDP